MKRETIVQLHGAFESLVKSEEESGMEFWLARELQSVLGYDKWDNFLKVIQKAVTSCTTAGYDPSDHFLEAGKMVTLGSGAQREILDYMLTRYACYVIAQNGDPSKEPIAFAQTYFAIQTRRAELIETRLADVERLQARKKLTVSGDGNQGGASLVVSEILAASGFIPPHKIHSLLRLGYVTVM